MFFGCSVHQKMARTNSSSSKTPVIAYTTCDLLEAESFPSFPKSTQFLQLSEESRQLGFLGCLLLLNRCCLCRLLGSKTESGLLLGCFFLLLDRCLLRLFTELRLGRGSLLRCRLLGCCLLLCNNLLRCYLLLHNLLWCHLRLEQIYLPSRCRLFRLWCHLFFRRYRFRNLLGREVHQSILSALSSLSCPMQLSGNTSGGSNLESSGGSGGRNDEKGAEEVHDYFVVDYS
mmetsp:Transcript_7488/g.13133  ORF Transcript_7488/g.13133 Transcript_7488/m.13133 type:complete len:230 (-) Transcript_7488:46-735(-)